MSRYKPYPAYKNSGIEWIGDVPENWELKPLKISVTHNDDVIPDSTDPEELINYVDISSVSYSEGISNVEEMAFGNAPSRARRKAKAGDVIVSTVRTYLKAVASVDEKFANCTFSTGFAVLRSRPNKLEPSFLKWLVLNDLFIQAVEAHSEGLSYPAINPPTLVALKTAIPSIDEQKKISSILDLETTRIDSLIAKKTRFIELLKEKRQALITHAVTKGLNPDVPMKDSGIEWIGEVPEHWTVIPIKRVARLKNLRTTESSSELQYIGLEDVESASGKYMPTEGSARQSEDSTVGVFSKGNILYGKLRPYLKKAIIAEMDGVCSTEFLVLDSHRVEPELLQKWLLTSEVTQQIESTCEGAKMPRADWEGIGSLPIPVPPNDEQSSVVKKIKAETTLIATLIAKTQHSIELLKERRSAFITAAVTGQIDLRGQVNSENACE